VAAVVALMVVATAPAAAQKLGIGMPHAEPEKGKKAKMKEMPKTGGISIGKAALVGLGAGSLLVGGGLVVRRTVR
jgi:LPXTG-motif cell wall-anchored protein